MSIRRKLAEKLGLRAAPARAHPVSAPRVLAPSIPRNGVSKNGFAAAARAAGSTSSSVSFRSEIEVPTIDHEVRIAEDGGSYWGPVDNASARAKAEGDTLQIDRETCIGCGTCVEHIDSVFFLNDDEAKATVLRQDGAMELIDDAIDACPVTCISWDGV